MFYNSLNKRKVRAVFFMKIINSSEYWYTRYPDLKPGQLQLKSNEKAVFVCNIHGEYAHELNSHRTRGCKRCGVERRARLRTTQQSEWYKRYHDLLPNQFLDNGCKSKAKFNCFKHGTYEQELYAHDTQGCPLCANELKAKKQTLPAEEWYKRYTDLVPGQTELHSHKKAWFACEYGHENYQQTLIQHKKTGCPVCGRVGTDKGRILGDEQWYARLPNLKPGQSDIRSGKKAIFICEKHGEYLQIPNDNARCGCPICSVGRYPYFFFQWLKSVYNGTVITNDRKQLRPQEIDFYLPDLKIGFEFNDIRTHDTPFVKTLDASKPSTYHINKHNTAEAVGIRLFHIWDFEWSDPTLRPILESIIKHALGISERKIYARQCDLRQIDSKIGNKFFKEHHLQGAAQAIKGAYFGLYYQDDLVGAICSTLVRGVHSISRMAFAKNTLVVGGQSRLIKAVESTLQTGDILEYFVLNDYFDGKSFKATGWEHVSKAPMVKYVETDWSKVYYRGASKYKERKERGEKGELYRIYTSGTTKWRKVIE